MLRLVHSRKDSIEKVIHMECWSSRALARLIQDSIRKVMHLQLQSNQAQTGLLYRKLCI